MVGLGIAGGIIGIVMMLVVPLNWILYYDRKIERPSESWAAADAPYSG